jgi:hypothetical protein
MNKFKALLIKDLHINKKALVFPVWVILGFYALMLISVIVAYFKGDLEFQTLLSVDNEIPSAAINYVVQLAISMIPGVLMLISTLMISQSLLNEDIKKNYELFHRSQPVSCWMRSGSKFIIGTFGNWVVMLAIILFNFIVTSLILLSVKQFVFYPAIAGMLQTFFMCVKSSLVLGALAFFFSSIFKDKAFFKGIALILGIEFLIFLINLLFQWNLPAPGKYISELFHGNMASVELSMMDEMTTMELIKKMWREIFFTMKSLYQILFSAVMFGVATLIYENKEVKID